MRKSMNTVNLSLLGHTTQIVGKPATLIKGLLILAALYVMYKFATQKTINITVA